MHEVRPVSILLCSARGTELPKKLCRRDLEHHLATTRCKERAIVRSIESNDTAAALHDPDSPITLYNLPALRGWETPG